MCLKLVFLFLISVNSAFAFSDPHHYLRIIIGLCNYHSINSVYFTHSGDGNRSLQFRYELVFSRWIQEFSDKNLGSLYFNFRDISSAPTLYENAMRPLLVIILTDARSILRFSQATKNINIGACAWLVIFRERPANNEIDYCYHPPENIFNLKFNSQFVVVCYDDPVLREWYSLYGNITDINNFAYYKLDIGVSSFPQLGLHERRNMGGVKLRAVVVKASAVGNALNGTLKGFLGEMVKEFGQVCNFSIKVVKETDGYGKYTASNNSWTGAIGDVIDGIADIGCSEFAVTYTRLNFVDFSLPLIMSKNYLYIKEPGMYEIQWSSYFQPFGGNVWLAIGLTIIFIPFILALVMYEKGQNITQLIMDNYIYVWGIYCQQGIADFPEKSSARLAYFALLVSAMIISANYSATLISFLAVRKQTLPFISMEDFAAQGTYKMTLVRNSADYETFANAKDPVGKKMMSLMVKESALAYSTFDGFAKICKNSKLAFYTKDIFLKIHGRTLPCKVLGVYAGRVESIGLILTKRSPYTGYLNIFIQKFFSSGIVNRFKLKDIKEDVDTVHPAIDFWNIVPLLTIFVIGIVLGAIILITEKSYNNYHSYRRMKTKELTKLLHNMPFEKKVISQKRPRKTFNYQY